MPCILDPETKQDDNLICKDSALKCKGGEDKQTDEQSEKTGVMENGAATNGKESSENGKHEEPEESVDNKEDGDAKADKESTEEAVLNPEGRTSLFFNQILIHQTSLFLN